MKAAHTPKYGSADVLEIREVAAPAIGARDVLVEIVASTVTAGDLRLRSADFPSLSAIGRLFIGLRKPKHPIQGTMFAGRVVGIGSDVTQYTIGDDVFGFADHGAYAERLAVREDGAMARLPKGMRHDEAAAVPYGAFTALRFLRDLGGVAPGDKVLVVGAAGGVGRFAVQVAKHLGAVVTAVCRRDSFELVRDLGADHVIDREREDFTKSDARYDVVFDTAGVTTFRAARTALGPNGRYLTLFLSVGLLVQMLVTWIAGGRRAKFSVFLPERKDMEEVRTLMERGTVRPLITRRFPLARIAEAHAEAERRRSDGSVVVTMSNAA